MRAPQAIAGAAAHALGGLDGDDLGPLGVMAGVEPGAGANLENAAPRPAGHSGAERIDLRTKGEIVDAREDVAIEEAHKPTVG